MALNRLEQVLNHQNCHSERSEGSAFALVSKADPSLRSE
jgi:hypothetical protein